MTSTHTLRTIRGAANALARYQVSAVELLDECLAVVGATEHLLHAWVDIDLEQAMREARAADRALGRSEDHGLLLGIPTGVKDIIDVSGYPTRCGSPLLADTPAANHDADIVRRVRHAGGVIIGKTTTQEFAAGVMSPPARSPWNPDHAPGGSSGGSAVAVATGSALAALGSDTGGSIRIPAAVVGVCGFKPAYGALPTSGVSALSPSLDTLGPLGRTVDDVYITWSALIGRSAPVIRGAVKGHRIGFPYQHFRDRLQPAVAEAIEGAASLLQQLGANIVEVDWNDAARARGASYVINRVETGDALWHHVNDDDRRLGKLNPDLQVRIRGGRLVPAVTYLEALRQRRLVRDSMAEYMHKNRLSAILTPGLPATSIPAGTSRVHYQDGSEPVGVGFTRLTMPFNATGQPVLSVPCGFDHEGLPIGLQLAGAIGSDDLLFAIGHAYEEAAGWTSHLPAVLGGNL